MTSAQLSEWEAYDKLDPIGTWREDFRMATLASLMTNIVNSLYGEKGKIKTTTALDFMPEWNKEKKKEKPVDNTEKFKKILMSIAKVQNKKESNLKNTPPANKKRK